MYTVAAGTANRKAVMSADNVGPNKPLKVKKL